MEATSDCMKVIFCSSCSAPPYSRRPRTRCSSSSQLICTCVRTQQSVEFFILHIDTTPLERHVLITRRYDQTVPSPHVALSLSTTPAHGRRRRQHRRAQPPHRLVCDTVGSA